MNWIKQNKKLAAILGVMIAGGIGLGVLLYFSWSDYTAQVEEWTTMDHKASALENSKFTPNAENVALLGQKLDEYRDKFSLLQQVLLSAKLQQKIEPISETEFQARLKERTRAVIQKAGKLTALPKDFALGFDEYTATLPSSPEVAAELNVQLDVMETLVNTLLAAGVKSIDLLERTRLPTERGGSAAAAAVVAPQATKPKPQKNAKAAPLAAQASAPVVDRYPIKCLFTCDEGPLQRVMNNLANPAETTQFLAVRQLHVENEKQEAPSKDEIHIILKTPENIITKEPQVPPHTMPVVQPMKKDAAQIIGAELLKVYFEVDYLRFRKPASEGAPASTPATSTPASKR